MIEAFLLLCGGGVAGIMVYRMCVRFDRRRWRRRHPHSCALYGNMGAELRIRCSAEERIEALEEENARLREEVGHRTRSTYR